MTQTRRRLPRHACRPAQRSHTSGSSAKERPGRGAGRRSAHREPVNAPAHLVLDLARRACQIGRVQRIVSVGCEGAASKRCAGFTIRLTKRRFDRKYEIPYWVGSETVCNKFWNIMDIQRRLFAYLKTPMENGHVGGLLCASGGIPSDPCAVSQSVLKHTALTP